MNWKRLLPVILAVQIIAILCLEKKGYFYKWREKSYFFNHLQDQKTGKITCTVLSLPYRKQTGQSFIAECLTLDNFSIQDKIIVNTKYRKRLGRNDVIEITGSIFLPDTGAIFDYRKYLQRNGISFVFIPDSEPKILKSPGSSRFYELADRTYEKINIEIDRNLSGLENGILKGLMTGEKSNLPEEIQLDFINSGVSHILAVSGFNFAVLILAVIMLFRVCRLPEAVYIPATIFLSAIYAAITRFNPSVTRAFIMSSISLLSILLDRENDVRYSILLSSLIILLFSPLDIFDIGFQLSYLATLGILYFSKRISSFLSFIRINWVREAVSVSLSAQIAVLPVTAYHFNKINVDAILTNIIVVPGVGLMTIVGFAGVFLSFLPVLSNIIFSADWLLIKIMYAVVRFFAHIPFASVNVISPGPVYSFLYYLLLYYVISKKDNFKSALLILLFISVFTYGRFSQKTLQDFELQDAGKTFFWRHKGKNVLHRAGLSEYWTKNDLLLRLLKSGVYYVDSLYLADQEPENINQFLTLVKNMKVKEIILERAFFDGNPLYTKDFFRQNKLNYKFSFPEK